MIQRRFSVTDGDGVVSEVEVTNSLEMYNLLYRESAVAVEMIWDKVFGDKRMLFKSPRSERKSWNSKLKRK
jgi:hypothetical protein